jgi:parallel beta-helix repeat protein
MRVTVLVSSLLRVSAVLIIGRLGACAGGPPAGTDPGSGAGLPVTGASIAIGEWTDSPGVCPAGVPRVEIHTVGELESASRGEGEHAADAPGTCYFVHDGTYRQGGRVALYVLRGGTEAAPRRFVGESRDHVVIVGRGGVEDGVSHVVIQNVTFTLNGYRQDGSFSTLTLGNGSDVTIDHVTLTGDCATGRRGGHIETNRTQGLLVEACLVENFGQCSGDGRLDHGIYLNSGKDITLRNNVIRGNSSRGIQLYTADGQSGTLDNIVIENNRIYANGHGDYQDGVAINGSGTGTISRVTIQRNLIYRNAYSGIRFAGPATSSIQVVRNTFFDNGVGSSSGSRSEINIDDRGMAAGALASRNILAAGHNVINDCYDAASLGFALRDNLVQGSLPRGSAGGCLSDTVAADPNFYDAAAGDLRTRNPVAAGYGAYAP